MWTVDRMHARCSKKGGKMVNTRGRRGMEPEANIRTYLDAEKCNFPVACVSTSVRPYFHGRRWPTGNIQLKPTFTCAQIYVM